LSEDLKYHKSGLFFASLADAYIEKGMYEDAAELLKEGITLHPEYTYAHRLLGICYFQLKDLAGAERELKLALRDSSDLTARYYLARVYLLQNRIDDAKATLDEINRIDPDSKEAFEIRKELAHLTGEETEEVVGVTQILKELISLPAIDGAILLEKDGLPIASEGVAEDEELSGFISGIANQSSLTGAEFGIGEVESFSITTKGRCLINIVGPDAILTILTNHLDREGLAALYGTRFSERIRAFLER